MRQEKSMGHGHGPRLFAGLTSAVLPRRYRFLACRTVFAMMPAEYLPPLPNRWSLNIRVLWHNNLA